MKYSPKKITVIGKIKSCSNSPLLIINYPVKGGMQKGSKRVCGRNLLLKR